jgi:hypothetical protein
MTKLAEFLGSKQEAIVRRWLEAALSSYAAAASAAFTRQTDPFANPVGHSLRQGTREIFQALLADAKPDRIRRYLEPIISIRAVQEMSAAQAVGVVFQLKDAVRAGLGDAAAQPELAAELAQLDTAIDRVALCAFDLYVECRERISQARVQEATGRFAWIARKMNQRSSDPSPVDAEKISRVPERARPADLP